MLDKLKNEAIGVVDTLAAVGSGIASQAGANVVAAGKDLLGHYDEQYEDSVKEKEKELSQYTSWLERNKHAKDTRNYKIVQDYVDNERKSVKRLTPEEDAANMAAEYTWEPSGPEGRRNLEAIGMGAESIYHDAKIPPLIPGASNVSRINIKGMPKTVVTKGNTPRLTSQAIKERARVLFDDAKGEQVKFNAAAVEKIADKMEAEISAFNVSKDSKHGRSAMQVIKKMRDRAKSGDITIDELMEYQDLTNDVIKVGVDKSKNLANNMSRAVDDFIAKADETVLANGTPESIAKFNQARKLWGKARRTADLEDMLDSIQLKKGTGADSAAYVVDEMKAKVAQLLSNKKKSQFYTPEEKALLRQFTETGRIDRLLGGIASLDTKIGLGGGTGAGIIAGSVTGDLATGGLVTGGTLLAGAGAKGVKAIKDSTKIDKLIKDVQNLNTNLEPGLRNINLQSDYGLLIPRVIDDQVEDEVANVQRMKFNKQGGLL